MATTLAGSAEHVAPGTRGGGINSATLLMSVLTVGVALLTVTPVAVALIASFRTAPIGQPGVWTASGIVHVLKDPSTLTIVWTTIWMGVVRAGIATCLAVLLAWILAR